jgi:Leucine-rich repeat (LRR) protein
MVKVSYYNNRLTELPEFPSNLEILDCSYNQITKFPDLPKTLKELYCNNNKLTELPELPNSLEILDCSWNPLTQLPRLPNNLKVLCCFHLKTMTHIPRLPKSLEYINLYSCRIFNFGDINPNVPIFQFKKYREYHNALIDFQRHIQSVIWRRNASLKERCRRTINIYDIKYKSEDLPRELIEYLNKN